MTKKVIYFMPDNPISGKAGNVTRLNQILDRFNSNDKLKVTFVSLSDWGNWTAQDTEIFKTKYPKIDLLLLDKKNKKNLLKYIFLYKIPYNFNNSIDLTSLSLKLDFKKIVKKIEPNFIVISYAHWGNLLPTDLPDSCKTIIDTHDFITAQNCNKKSKIGRLFQTEIKTLNKFDDILTYSIEEKYIFEQFTTSKVSLIPISFNENKVEVGQEKKYDILYVASDNPHNKIGIQWFLKEVLPNINPNLTIHIVGKIGLTLEQNFPNVKIYGMVDDIDEFYKKSRISICPMLTGTGIKIKVLEALSYGLPTVTNCRGIDGLTNKSNNGCIVEKDPKCFANAIEKLLTDNIYYSKIQNEAQAYFSQNYTIELENKIFNRIFE